MVTFSFFPPNLLQWTFETAEIIPCAQRSPGLLAEPEGLSHAPVPGSPLTLVCALPGPSARSVRVCGRHRSPWWPAPCRWTRQLHVGLRPASCSNATANEPRQPVIKAQIQNQCVLHVLCYNWFWNILCFVTEKLIVLDSFPWDEIIRLPWQCTAMFQHDQHQPSFLEVFLAALRNR